MHVYKSVRIRIVIAEKWHLEGVIDKKFGFFCQQVTKGKKNLFKLSNLYWFYIVLLIMKIIPLKEIFHTVKNQQILYIN